MSFFEICFLTKISIPGNFEDLMSFDRLYFTTGISHFHFLAHQLPQIMKNTTHLSNTATSHQFWLVPATTQGDEQQQRPGDSGLSNHLHLDFMISTLEVSDGRGGWESVISIATQAKPNLSNYLNMGASETSVKISRFRFSSTSLSKQWRRTTLM